MKKIYYVVLFLIMSQNFYAQDPFVKQCHTEASSPDLTFIDNSRHQDYLLEPFYVKIYVHVLAHDDYGPGQSVLEINEAIGRLEAGFEDRGIYFLWDGEIDYIQNNNWHNNPSSYKTQIWNYNDHTDGVDIYLGNSLYQGGYAEAAGIGEQSSFIVSGYSGLLGVDEFDRWPQSEVIVHEMGHVLYLWHTFHGTNEDDNGTDPNAKPECKRPLDR